jgi:hypothetical protein
MGGSVPFVKGSPQSLQRRDWLESEYSAQLRRENAHDMQKALERLCGTCKGTTDPNVARAYGQYEHFVKLGELLGSRVEADSEET